MGRLCGGVGGVLLLQSDGNSLALGAGGDGNGLNRLGTGGVRLRSLERQSSPDWLVVD